MVVLEGGLATDLGMSAERIDLARQLMHEQVAAGRSPSVAAVVLRHGRIVLQEAVGVQRPDGPDLTVDHIWPIASGGKPLVAATVLSLVEEGLVGVMQPITDLLPELMGTGNDDVLVHHLLTHTAGWESDLFSGRLMEVAVSGELPPLPAEVDFITHLGRWVALHPNRVAPTGEIMVYGNCSYALLGEIVRRVTGGTLDAALRRRIFAPLGMDSSALIVGDDLRSRLVRRAPHLPFGSSEAPGGIAFQGEMWESSDSGETGIHASPTDLARFGQAILDSGRAGATRVLAPTTVRSMCIDQVPGVPALLGTRQNPVAGWGYGFAVVNEQRWAYFGGGLVPPGSVSHPGAGGIDFWIDFEHGMVGVIFEVLSEMNAELQPISGMANRLQDVITAAVLT